MNLYRNSLNGRILLPLSKSISNRVLVMGALSGQEIAAAELSDSSDTAVMYEALHSEKRCFDIQDAGTAMRFLTAYLAQKKGVWEVTGSERMKQRPIGGLVEALNGLGARIEYKEQVGFPPLLIHGVPLEGGEVEIEASVSSQFVSALLLIAPSMLRGLKIRLRGKVVSGAYIRMTMALMNAWGAEVCWGAEGIDIAAKPYRAKPYRVERDWSSASYFYEAMAIAGGSVIRFPGLWADSIQGDAGQVELWERLGVSTAFDEEGAVVTCSSSGGMRLEYDFTDMPDLVLSFAVACCMREVHFMFSGVETLRIKETDRIAALAQELKKLGYCLKMEGKERIVWEGEKCTPLNEVKIVTYNDHRMAMAFAPVGLKYKGLRIDDRMVVNKSFPTYWEELERVCVCG
ncbi:MAG: 3-phosphoshikimate 1-carboxyvinyltransferase [Odoribacter sp.]